jgi:hypothetical protein
MAKVGKVFLHPSKMSNSTIHAWSSSLRGAKSNYSGRLQEYCGQTRDLNGSIAGRFLLFGFSPRNKMLAKVAL